MRIEEIKRRAVEKLWALMAVNPPPNEDVSVCEEYFNWLVGRLAEDPDFQALVNAKGDARQRDDWPFGGLS